MEYIHILRDYKNKEECLLYGVIGPYLYMVVTVINARFSPID